MVTTQNGLTLTFSLSASGTERRWWHLIAALVVLEIIAVDVIPIVGITKDPYEPPAVKLGAPEPERWKHSMRRFTHVQATL